MRYCRVCPPTLGSVWWKKNLHCVAPVCGFLSRHVLLNWKEEGKTVWFIKFIFILSKQNEDEQWHKTVHCGSKPQTGSWLDFPYLLPLLPLPLILLLIVLLYYYCCCDCCRFVLGGIRCPHKDRNVRDFWLCGDSSLIPTLFFLFVYLFTVLMYLFFKFKLWFNWLDRLINY